MFFAIVSSITLLQFWLKDDDKLKPITDFVKVPIASKLTIACASYLSGFVAPFLVQLVIKVFKGAFNVTSLAIPLFGAELAAGAQSYSTSEILSSMAWKIYNIVFVAGTKETFTYNFGTIILGVVGGLTIFMLASKNERTLIGLSRKHFVIGFAFLVSILAFVFSHLMNGSYTLNNFIWAAIFLLISNISIYLGGIMFSFWMGYHQGNNLLWLITEEGFRTVAEGFVSWFGLVFVLVFGLIVFYVIRKTADGTMKKDIKWYFGWS